MFLIAFYIWILIITYKCSSYSSSKKLLFIVVDTLQKFTTGQNLGKKKGKKKTYHWCTTPIVKSPMQFLQLRFKEQLRREKGKMAGDRESGDLA